MTGPRPTSAFDGSGPPGPAVVTELPCGIAVRSAVATHRVVTIPAARDWRGNPPKGTVGKGYAYD